MRSLTGMAVLAGFVVLNVVMLSMPALAQGATTYNFKITNYTPLVVTTSCDSAGEASTVAVDDTSPLLTCSTDSLTVEQRDSHITRTFSRAEDYNYGDSAGDDCEADDILRPVLSGNASWVAGVLIDASVFPTIQCEHS